MKYLCVFLTICLITSLLQAQPAYPNLTDPIAPFDNPEALKRNRVTHITIEQTAPTNEAEFRDYEALKGVKGILTEQEEERPVVLVAGGTQDVPMKTYWVVDREGREVFSGTYTKRFPKNEWKDTLGGYPVGSYRYYDSAGRLATQQSYYYTDAQKINTRQSTNADYYYDPQTGLLNRSRYSSGDYTSKNEWKYDEKNRLIEHWHENTKQQTNKPVLEYEYIYQADSNKIIHKYPPGGSETHLYYNEKDQNIKKVFHDNPKRRNRGYTETFLSYNEAGKLEKEVSKTLGRGAREVEKKYHYNKEGLLIRITAATDHPSYPYSVTTYTYYSLP